jgi:hypothetical protein
MFSTEAPEGAIKIIKARIGRINYSNPMAKKVVIIAGLLLVLMSKTVVNADWQWEQLHLNGGGALIDIKVDPNNSNIVYCGSDASGMFKSMTMEQPGSASHLLLHIVLGEKVL